MKFALIASSIAISMLASCGQSDIDVKSDAQNSATPVSSEGSSQAAPAMSAPVNIPLNLRGLTAVGQPGGAGLNPEHGKPGHRCDIAVGAPLNGAASASAAVPAAQTAASTAAITASSGLNPEHGKPGHRCDIAVGAPLNSSPASNTAQPIAVPTQASNPVIQSAASAGSVSTAPGMNPEHGKPGHRCDIAVGAPLNSKPATAAATKPAATPAVTAVAPGMNPQHGQPGHRCDIAVGAPLNSKPTPAATTTPEPASTETKKDSSGGR